MKALMVSVGTGAGSADKAVESLSSAISYSIRSSNPDKVFFVVSKESVQKTLPRVLQTMAVPHEIITVEDPDNVNKIYEDLAGKFREIKRNFDQVSVDFTSGTKAMTGALAVLGSLYEVDTFSYVTGKRSGGIVVKGTEQVLNLQPYSIIVEKKLGEAMSLFDRCQYDSCLIILDELVERIRDPELHSQLAPFRNAASAYSAWDRFDHSAASQILKEVKPAVFDRNKGFLGRLLTEPEREPYLIADLISNAMRRGEIEHKYDDAVARLYRTIELIAQYRLKPLGIADTGNVPKEKIPSALLSKWNLGDGKIRLGLYQDYELLAELNDDIGQAFLQDKHLRDLLQKRNASILAHGVTPVTKTEYEQLKEAVLSYARRAVVNIDGLIHSSTFVTWPR